MKIVEKYPEENKRYWSMS